MAKRVRNHVRARIAVSDAILELAFEIANDIFDQRWSRAGVNLLTASLAQLSSESVHVNRQLETFARGTQLDESLLTLFKELSKRPNGRALLKLQASAAKDKDMAALFRKLSTGKSRGVNLPDPSPARAKGGDHIPVVGIAIAMLTMIHTAFNTAKANRHPGDQVYDTVKQMRENLEQSLYAVCFRGTNPVEVAGIVNSYATNLLSSVVNLTHATREGSDELAKLYAQGAGGKAEKLGHNLIQWSTEIRESVSSLTSACALCLGGFTEQHSFLTDPEQVARRAFAFATPDGKNTNIGSFKKGELSDIAGRVTDVKVRRKGNHLITTIDLTDPSSGKSTTAALSFINGHNMGITIDAFFSCTGVFHAKSTLNRNKPAFHISQIPLAALAKSSWRAGFLDLGSTFMEVWPNGHLAKWTLGQHTTTDFEKIGTGAGEVLYRLTPKVIGKW